MASASLKARSVSFPQIPSPASCTSRLAEDEVWSLGLPESCCVADEETVGVTGDSCTAPPIAIPLTACCPLSVPCLSTLAGAVMGKVSTGLTGVRSGGLVLVVVAPLRCDPPA